MKKNSKITNKLKLNLGINRLWAVTNTLYTDCYLQQKNLKVLQIVHQFFNFSGRAINFLFRYFLLKSIFQKWKKKKLIINRKLILKMIFFFKKLLKKRKSFFFWRLFVQKRVKRKKKQKKLYVANLLNFFSSIQNISCTFKATRNFYLCTLVVNLSCFTFSPLINRRNYRTAFYRRQIKLAKLSEQHTKKANSTFNIIKNLLKKDFQNFFRHNSVAPVQGQNKVQKLLLFQYKHYIPKYRRAKMQLRKQRLREAEAKRKDPKTRRLQLIMRVMKKWLTLQKFLGRNVKKNLQYFFLLKFKYLIESKLTKICGFPFYLHIVLTMQLEHYVSFMFESFHQRLFRKTILKRFPKHFAIKSLHKIQTDLLSSLAFGFVYTNAQLIADLFAIGINRTRKQIQFFYWFQSILKYYRTFGPAVYSIKCIIFGKLGGKLRTRVRKIILGQYNIKTQTFALKVTYGYSSAETYTGTFGVHVWLYHRDIMPAMPTKLFAYDLDNHVAFLRGQVAKPKIYFEGFQPIFK